MQAESKHGVTTQTWNLVEIEKLNSTNRELCNIPYKEAYIDLSTKNCYWSTYKASNPCVTSM